MKYIIITRKPIPGKSSKQMVAEIQDTYPTPEALLTVDTSARVFDADEMAGFLNLTKTNDLQFVIEVSDDLKQYNNDVRCIPKDFFLKNNGQPMVCDLLADLKNFESLISKPKVKQKHEINLNFILCHFDEASNVEALKRFDDLKEKPRATRAAINRDKEEVDYELSLAVEKFDPNKYQGEQFSFYVIACDCTDQYALNRVDEIMEMWPNARFILVPVNDDPLKRRVSMDQIEGYAEERNALYVPHFLSMDWKDVFNKAVGTYFPPESDPKRRAEEKFRLAQEEINRLIDQLSVEVESCKNSAITRFFTDYNHTKEVKLDALRQLKDGGIASFDDLQRKAEALKADPRVMLTSWPLTSRTATLLNEITDNNGNALLEKANQMRVRR